MWHSLKVTPRVPACSGHEFYNRGIGGTSSGVYAVCAEHMVHEVRPEPRGMRRHSQAAEATPCKEGFRVVRCSALSALCAGMLGGLRAGDGVGSAPRVLWTADSSALAPNA